jgi:hypothetical protein
MKKKLILFSSALLCLNVAAQETDSLKQKAQTAIADKFPFTRVLDVRYVQYLPQDFDSELLDDDYISGRIKNRGKMNFFANIPVVMKKKWNITATANYKYEFFELEQIKDFEGVPAAVYNKKYDFHYLSAALSFTGFTSLFKKPFIYNASFIVDGTERKAQRIKGFVGGSIVLKANAKTKMTLGLIVLIDPTSPVPAAPVFTLDHKFNSGWMLDIILPQRFLLKHNVYENGRISFGTELVTDGFYFQSSQISPGNVLDYRQLELRSGVTYEYWFGDGLIGTFKTGLSNVFNSRISQRGESTNDYLVATKQDGTGYFSLGFSYNPFGKKKKA